MFHVRTDPERLTGGNVYVMNSNFGRLGRAVDADSVFIALS
jgi:hypothetical protein